MKIFLLIHEQDTDAAWGCDVKSFLSHESALSAMRSDWEWTVKAWEYEGHEHCGEDGISCGNDNAVIREGDEYESWRIEEQELDV